MKSIVERYKQWKDDCDNDHGYIYDEIRSFVDGDLDRGDLVSIFEYLEDQQKH